MRELKISSGAFVWALQGICQLHRISFAVALVQQQFPTAPHDVTGLQRPASALGLENSLKNRTPTPFCVEIQAKQVKESRGL